MNNNPLSETDPTGFEDDSVTDDGGGGNDEGDSGNSMGGVSTVGSSQGGTAGGVMGLPEQNSWSCYGNCGGGWANSIQVPTQSTDPAVGSGMVQVPGSGTETHSVINPDGSTTPLEDMAQLSNGTPMLNAIEITAPAYQWVTLGGFNFAALGTALVPTIQGLRLCRRLVLG